jgi:hypothetical protein
MLCEAVATRPDAEAAELVRTTEESVDGAAAGQSPPLFTAVEHGKVLCIEALARRGANPALPGRGFSPLCWAAMTDNGTLEVLLRCFPRVDVNEQRSGDLRTALHDSAYYGRERSVRLLLQHGARTDLVDRYGLTPEAVARASTESSPRIADHILNNSRAT